MLLEIPPILLVHENQVEVVLQAELISDVPVRRGQSGRYALQKKSNGYAFPLHGSSVHNFKLYHGFAFVEERRARSCGFSTYQRQLHVFDFNADQQEVDFPNDYVRQAIIYLCCCCESCTS